MLVALHFRPADVLPLQLHPTRSDRPPRRSGMEAAAAASSLFVAEAGSKQARWLATADAGGATVLVALHFRPADVLPLQLHPTRSDRPPRRSGMEAAAAASSLFVAEAGSKQASSQLAHWLSKTEGEPASGGSRPAETEGAS